MVTVCACCTDYLNFGCYSMCDETVSNPTILAAAAGTYTASYDLGGIVHNIETTGVEGEALEFDNNFPVGITYFIITDTEGVSICYYISIQRLTAICPEVIIDEKTLSPC